MFFAPGEATMDLRLSDVGRTALLVLAMRADEFAHDQSRCTMLTGDALDELAGRTIPRKPSRR